MRKQIKSDDGSIVVVDSHEFGTKAKRRHTRAEAKRRRAINNAGDYAFRATCPWCHAPNVVMSVIDRNRPSKVEPLKGDLIECDYCRRLHVVVQVNNYRVQTYPVSIGE